VIAKSEDELNRMLHDLQLAEFINEQFLGVPRRRMLHNRAFRDRLGANRAIRQQADRARIGPPDASNRPTRDRLTRHRASRPPSP
jgi:hypothetical protein